MTSPILEAEDLCKRYGGTVAVEDLNIAIGPGETVCLLGANGAGKTTTLSLFLGFTAPTSGAVRVCGRPVPEDPVEARRKLGYVAEVVALYPTLSGRENLAFFNELAGVSPSAEAIDDVLGRLRFPLDRLEAPAGTYSKGMRQKVGLAVALLKGATAILLDEPLSGLDPAASNDLVQVLRHTASGGTSLLISTHDVFRAREVADRIGIMRHGRLVDLLSAEGLSGAELEQLYLTHMAEQAA